MRRQICVYGLWHLGSVTAACLAEQGHGVVGLDPDVQRVADLREGIPPVREPDLPELIASGLRTGALRFTTDPQAALANADVLWVTFDTPVDDEDHADVDWVRQRLAEVRPHVKPGTLVLISSQVPVGFSGAVRASWREVDPTLEFACSPENLRLGQALAAFRDPARVIVGMGPETARARVEDIFGSLRERIEWMSLESAEMTKHALNAFLAASVAYINEVARLCEVVGADAAEVERGLRTEPRIGPRAYVSPGGPIGGGTLARDVTYLGQLAEQHGLAAPVMQGILASNVEHTRWADQRVQDLVRDIPDARVALLGLTYKAGTDTLRRSTALELAQRLIGRGFAVSAYDPAVRELPGDSGGIALRPSAEEALDGADVAVLGTAWPEFASVDAATVLRTMRHPWVVDQTGFLSHLTEDDRLVYMRVGRSPGREAVAS